MKAVSFVVLAVVALVVMVACGGEEPSAAPAAPAESLRTTTTVRVVVPNAKNLQWMNFWIAQGAGLFKEQGLDVQVVVPPNPNGAPQFLLQGQAEVALFPPPLYLNLMAQQAPILIFANLFENDPINLIVRKEVAEARKLVPDAPLAERLKGLQGLRVGVAPEPVNRLRILFASVGMDIDRDIQVVILGEERQQAFAGNPIDVLQAHTPFLEKALVEQGGVLLVNQSRGDIPELAGFMIHSLLTTRSFASANPKIVVALTRAVYRAQQLVHRDSKAGVDALLRSSVPGLERRFVETLVPLYEPAIPKTPEVTVEGLERTSKVYIGHGAPPDLSKINLADYVAPQFAKQAVAGTR